MSASAPTRSTAITSACTTRTSRAFRSKRLAIKTTSGVDYVEGVENPTEASENIVRWLVKHDYSDEDTAKVVGGNALRLLKEVWE